MTSNSPTIQIILIAFIITICLYNIFCIYVTYLLNSIWHAILDNFRPVAVWSTDLALYYVFTNHAFGEEWTKYSWIQFAGMLILFVGTAVYNGTLRVHGWDYEYLEDENDEVNDQNVAGGVASASSQIRRTPSLKTAMFASPDITNSPIIRRNIKRQWNDASSTYSNESAGAALLQQVESQQQQQQQSQPNHYGSMYSSTSRTSQKR